jgi:hypothetical protein
MFGAAAVLAAVAGFACWLAGSVPGVLISVLVLGYLASLLIAPKRKCRSCKGSGVHGDPLGSGAHRRCWSCKGEKEHVRWGTAVLRPGVHRKIRSGQHGRNW